VHFRIDNYGNILHTDVHVKPWWFCGWRGFVIISCSGDMTATRRFASDIDIYQILMLFDLVLHIAMPVDSTNINGKWCVRFVPPGIGQRADLLFVGSGEHYHWGEFYIAQEKAVSILDAFKLATAPLFPWVDDAAVMRARFVICVEGRLLTPSSGLCTPTSIVLSSPTEDSFLMLCIDQITSTKTSRVYQSILFVARLIKSLSAILLVPISEHLSCRALQVVVVQTLHQFDHCFTGSFL
jgi:hypothetical protein